MNNPEHETAKQSKADLWFSRATALSNELALVLRGLRDGSIKSKPIVDMDPDAEEFMPVSLEDHIATTLTNNGFTVKAQP